MLLKRFAALLARCRVFKLHSQKREAVNKIDVAILQFLKERNCIAFDKRNFGHINRQAFDFKKGLVAGFMNLLNLRSHDSAFNFQCHFVFCLFDFCYLQHRSNISFL
jgi:hypothetical protein